MALDQERLIAGMPEWAKRDGFVWLVLTQDVDSGFWMLTAHTVVGDRPRRTWRYMNKVDAQAAVRRSFGVSFDDWRAE